MAGRFCQECGAPNEAAAKYCARCGSELRAGVAPGATPPPPAAGPAPVPPSYFPPYTTYPYAAPYVPYPPPYPYAGPYPGYPNYADVERTKQIDHTKTGLLLLAIGFLIGWVPIIGGIGVILGFIGAILVILGRAAFGARHSTFVILSVVLYIAFIVLAVAFFLWFLFVGFQAASQGNPRPFASAFWLFVGGIVVASVIARVAEVLFVHELEKPVGRYFLYAGLLASIVVPVVAVLVLKASFDALLTGIANGTITNPNDPRIGTLRNVGDTLGLLGAIPSVLLGVAYLLAWQRIERREIPAGPPGPGAPSPYGPPPSPGLPPSTPPGGQPLGPFPP